ncbi:MAG TPA: amino acid permease [Victivallales bacterium]|nr:amino acid permease [Victivallales bacterium]
MKDRKKLIGVLTLVTINVLAIDSLRNIPLTAPAGLVIVIFYIAGTLFMFLPCAIATAELTTKWPETGGLSCWVETSLGKNTSFFVVWMQWVYNLVWFPSITAFAATQLAYSGNFLFKGSAISVSNNVWFVLIVSLSIFWLATLINCFGMKIISVFSIFGAIVGKLIPMLLVIVLAAIWVFSGNHIALNLSISSSFSHGDVIGLLVIVLFSLMGIEMASSHAGSVRNPKKNFPRALWITVMIIPISLILANLAIDMVVPAAKIDSRAGLMQSFDVFFRAFDVTFMDNVVALSLFIGAFAGAAAWSFGLSRYLKRIADNGFMPKVLTRENKYGIPQNALLFQAIVFTVLCLIYLFMPSIKSAYWLLSDLTAQLALIAYVIFFIAAIRLRLKYKWIKKVEYTAGPKWFSITIYVIGAIACILGILAGFILPSGSGMTLLSFDSILLVGIGIFLVIPAIIMIVKGYKKKKISKA